MQKSAAANEKFLLFVITALTREEIFPEGRMRTSVLQIIIVRPSDKRDFRLSPWTPTASHSHHSELLKVAKKEEITIIFQLTFQSAPISLIFFPNFFQKKHCCFSQTLGTQHSRRTKTARTIEKEYWFEISTY